MRISDWSSDVCSSDLRGRADHQCAGTHLRRPEGPAAGGQGHRLRLDGRVGGRHRHHRAVAGLAGRPRRWHLQHLPAVPRAPAHMKCPPEKADGYTGVTAIIAVLLSWIMAILTAGLGKAAWRDRGG